MSATLVGRRMGLPILGAALLLSGALAVLAFGLGLGATVVLLVVVGAGRALLDMASRTLTQRSVPAQLLGRVFGLLEGLTMAGLAAGALLVPALMTPGGSRLALLGVAAVLPLAAAVGGRGLFGLDSGTPVPVVEITLLRSVPRTATVVAHTAATVYQLDREPFLTAVLGHAPTQRRADRIAGTRLAAGRAPDGGDTT